MSDVFSAIGEVDANIEECKQRIESLQKQRAEILADAFRVAADKLALAKDVYWNVLSLKPSEIASAAGVGVTKLVANIGQHQSGCECIQCGKKLLAESRAHLAQIRKTGGLCPGCKRIKAKKSRQRSTEMFELHAARISLLERMPYSEYLETPEWNEKRTEALRRAGFKCSVCNSSGVTLDVHHRTYERRGRERVRDLTVLCRECHSVFHRERELA